MEAEYDYKELFLKTVNEMDDLKKELEVIHKEVEALRKAREELEHDLHMANEDKSFLRGQVSAYQYQIRYYMAGDK